MRNKPQLLSFRNCITKLFSGATIVGVFIMPAITYAASGGIGDFVHQFSLILNSVVPFIVGLAVFVIVYGIFGYIRFAGDEEKRKQGKEFMVWGLLGVFAMLSIWGLVSILVNSFNLDNSNTVITDIYTPIGDTPDPSTLPTLIDRVGAIGNDYVVPFLISIGVFIVILGIFNYIRQGDNEEKRAEARKFIVWGVISIFIMLSIWGLINIIVNSFNFDNSLPLKAIPELPKIQPSTP
jgi:uncharacterized membrane protein YidH (DUF202 family)